MRIAIDGFSLTRSDSGIEVYTREMVRGLVSARHHVEVYAYTDVALPPDENLLVKHSGYYPPLSQFRKLKWILSDINDLISPGIEIFHSPHFILPFNNPVPRKVVTVHDLAFLRVPHFFDWKTRLYYRLFLNRSLQVADAIICISESCVQDVAHFFPALRHKVIKVYNGFRNFSTIQPDYSILEELKIRSPFVMMLGTLNPRKNLFNGVRAFERLPKNVELVIVGKVPPHKVAFGRENPRVKYTGYISDERLAALYKTAELLLFPSFYEGFGFPVLEAMSCGLPVVTASNSALPEISGYHEDLLCDPANPADIAAKMILVMETGIRNELITHGFANLKRFSWDKMVAETTRVYGKA